MRSNEILEVGSKTLSGYASKGFFKSFSIACAPKDSAEFHFRWHFDKVFVIRLNSKSKNIHARGVAGCKTSLCHG